MTVLTAALTRSQVGRLAIGELDGVPWPGENQEAPRIPDPEIPREVTDDVARGVVAAYMGAWRKHAKDLATVNAVTPFEFADLGNAPTFSETWVEVAPA